MLRTLLLLLFVAVTTAAVPAFGQQPKYRAPRTETGQPDLQGMWDFNSGVPLQRPAAFSDRKFFTKEEFDKQRATIRNGLLAIVKFAPVEAVGLDWLDDAPPVDDLRTSLITYPQNGRLPALVKGVRRVPGFDDLLAALGSIQPGSTQLPIAQFAQFAAFGGGARESYTDFMMSERCLIETEVPLVPQLDANYIQIIQGSDHVVLRTEFSRRVIALGSGPRAGDNLRHWTGISRGRWEGETLVVDTRNFSDRLPSFAGAGNGRGKVVTERFTRTANNRIEYAATIADPQTFQDRIELSFPMVSATAQLFELACHEGNYSMRNSLAAARIDDETRKTQRQRGPRQQLTLFDPAGAIVAQVGEPGLYTQAAFSPDASQIAVIRTDVESGYPDVWTFDVATGRGRAITSDKAVDSAPLWSPDGKSIVYSSTRDNIPTLFRRAADGTGAEEQIYRHDGGAMILTDWSRDGRFLTFWSNQGQFVLPLTGNREPIAIGEGRGARFSPDGRWLAYSMADATQAGRFHTVVRPFDASAIASAASPAPRQVSQANAIGGIAWRSDGKELFFLSQPPGQVMMAVDITGSEPSAPRKLFPLPPGVGAPAQLSNISSPDGQKFVFAVTVPQAAAPAR
jgi:WD40 repeat protein